MKCEEIRDLVDAYIDDELSKKEHDLIKDHIENCPKCKADLEALENLRKNIKTLPYHSVPLGLAEKVSQALAREETKAPQKNIWVETSGVPRSGFRSWEFWERFK